MCNAAEGPENVIWRPSPNFTERRNGGVPAIIVLHYTAMLTTEAAYERLSNPDAEVSAHYLIGDDGQIIQLVDEADRAWHAGRSAWGDVSDVNSWSLGIELANPGPLLDLPPFPEALMQACCELIGALRRRWSIPVENVVGHACIAPGRKVDPGPKFDWRRVARQGQGVWLDPPLRPSDLDADADRFREAARRFGFSVDQVRGWSDPLRDVWDAYALRFLAPSPLAGRAPCAAGVAHLEALARRWPARNVHPGT